MRRWQQIWIGFMAVVSVIHSLRDALQFLEISTPLSTMLVKSTKPVSPSLIWHPLNTVILEVVMLVICFLIWRRQYFGVLGWVSVVGSLGTIVGFGVYWFLV